MLTWLEANSLGAVQTIAAVAQVVTAALIVGLTRRLAMSTDAYAKSAKDQVDELVQARLATIQPYLHLVSAGTTGSPDRYLVGLGVEVKIANLGGGAAIDAVARLDHDRLKFITITPPQTVAAGGSCKVFFSVNASSTDPGGLALSQDVRLVVAYRGLAGRRWGTTTPVTLGYERHADGMYRISQLAFSRPGRDH